jgi:hypothetical protein
MNGEQSTNEILRAVGSLEGTIKLLVDETHSHREELKSVSVTCQRFEAYSSARKDLPERVTAVEKIAQDYKNSIPERDERYKEISFLIGKYKFWLAVGASINLISIVLGFAFSRGWIHWGS